MRRKSFLYLFIAVLLGFSSVVDNAQKSEPAKSEDSQTGQKAVAKQRPLQTFLDISSLQMEERREIFSKLSNSDKAALFRLHLALQLVKRPNLSKDQTDLILEAILAVGPDFYDPAGDRANSKNFAQNVQARAGLIFSPQEVFEIFANLGGNQGDIDLFQKYAKVTASNFAIERRQDFSRLSPQDKSTVMRTHLALQMAKRVLDRRQLDFLLEAFRMASPDLYAAVKGTPEKAKADAALDAFGGRILDYFSKKEGTEILLSLEGEDGGPQGRPALCSCSTESDYCGWWHSNSSCGGGICQLTIGGCGTLLGYGCDALCHYN
jgi:hypothetical protein